MDVMPRGPPLGSACRSESVPIVIRLRLSEGGSIMRRARKLMRAMPEKEAVHVDSK